MKALRNTELFGEERTRPGGAGLLRILWLGAQSSLLFHPCCWGTPCWQDACLERDWSCVEEPESQMLGSRLWGHQHNF